MNRHRPLNCLSIGILLLTLVVLSTTIAFAQSAKLEGVIKGRNGSEVTLQTADGQTAVALLTDSTDVAQLQGALKARNKKMSWAAACFT